MLQGNYPSINESELDLCSPAKVHLPECQPQVQTFRLDLKRLPSGGDPVTFGDVSPVHDDVTTSEFLHPNEHSNSHEHLLKSNERLHH